MTYKQTLSSKAWIYREHLWKQSSHCHLGCLFKRPWLFGFPIPGMPYWQCHLDFSVAFSFKHYWKDLDPQFWISDFCTAELYGSPQRNWLVARLLLLSNNYFKPFLKLREQGLEKTWSIWDSSEKWKGLMALFVQARELPRPKFMASPWSLRPPKAKWLPILSGKWEIASCSSFSLCFSPPLYAFS